MVNANSLKRYLLFSTLVFLSSSGFASQHQASSVCGTSTHPMRIDVRHIEPNGIGYNKGYTTLEGFFSPTYSSFHRWIPFLDLRAHIFNDGKFAANGGLGLRYLSDSRVWGINGYYDYRNTHHQHYNQIGLGLESLGKFWDFRINGYLPVGKKTSHLYHVRFNKFKGNYLFVRRTEEFALKGADAEVGLHVDNLKAAPFYFAIGPYYLSGKGKATAGGQLRGSVELFHNYLRLEGNTSFDSLFKWIGQGQVSIQFPFGPRRKIIRRDDLSCSKLLMIDKRSLQRVDRHEIIPVDHRHVSSVVINPSTELPYFFWFVDNTSSSNGTFESPFNSLAAAQAASQVNDIIYVFPGDGTAQGMSSLFTMQDSQKLFGSGASQTLPSTLGMITIPQLTGNLPLLMVQASPMITTGSNCEISGLHIQSLAGGSVFGAVNVGSSVSIHDNLIEISNGADCIDIGNIQDDAGVCNIFNNTFVALDNSDTYGIFNFVSTGNITIQNNTFASATSASGFAQGIDISPGSIPLNPGNLTFVIEGNNFTTQANHTFDNLGAIIINQDDNTGPTTRIIQAYINNNTIYLSTDLFNPVGGVWAFGSTVPGSSPIILDLNNNVAFTEPPVFGYNFDNTSGDPTVLQVAEFNKNEGSRFGP